MDPTGDIPKYFAQVLELMDKLHKEETALLTKQSSKIPDYFLQTGALALKDFQKHIDVIIDVLPRRELLCIRNSLERRKERQEAVAREFMYVCIKKTPDGQQLFHLMDRISSSEEDKGLKKACKEALDALFAKNKTVLLEHIYSTPELAFDIIRGTDIPSLQEAIVETRRHDFEALGKKLELDLNHWYKDL